jgi:hypothetical protein
MDDNIRYTHLHNLLQYKLTEFYKSPKIKQSSDNLPLDIQKISNKFLKKNEPN